jgi:hypothetical protein
MADGPFMSSPKTIRQLFRQDVTRDIPPVVYFHEQSPGKVQDEVSEYIITGGWNKDHPNHKRVPDGIHEQYVRLLSAISREVETRRHVVHCRGRSLSVRAGPRAACR